jgi:hypothetical protein
LYVELNSNFMFRSNTCFSRRLDPEVGLLHEGLAGVTAVFQGHVVLKTTTCHKPRLPITRLFRQFGFTFPDSRFSGKVRRLGALSAGETRKIQLNLICKG